MFGWDIEDGRRDMELSGRLRLGIVRVSMTSLNNESECMLCFPKNRLNLVCSPTDDYGDVRDRREGVGGGLLT